MPILHTIPATPERCSPGRHQISNLCQHNVLYHTQSLECRNPQGFDIQPAPRGRNLERDRAYSGTGKGKGGSPDCRKVSSDLKRLEELPVSSYKWTWGETLTEDDVLGLRRIGTRPGRVPHSGYDISLAEGRQGREDSEGANTVESSLGQHDEIPAEANISPPSTDLHLPQYLSQADHRLVYNPFRLSNSVLPNPAPEDSQSAPAPADNMETIEQWS